jgi:hypothetical protein
MAEGGEGGDAVGAALDDVDRGDDALGVAVGGRLVEVGQRLLAPETDAVGERVEGGQAGVVDGGQERLEAQLGVARSPAR